MQRIYLDYASTTPIDKGVLKAMNPYLSKTFGNPSSIYKEGLEAKGAIDRARISVARSLEIKPEGIIFNSGGTEANNTAIFGIVGTYIEKGISLSKLHVVVSNVEHSSTRESVRHLEKMGVAVTEVPVNSEGIVTAQKIKEALRPETILISIMYANNEIGTVMSLRAISRAVLEHKENFPDSKILFHTDACQAPLYLDCALEHLGVDMMSLDAHKMYGPKGVGVLALRKNILLTPLLIGGGQESGRRSTTENVAGIVGISVALENAVKNRLKDSKRLKTLRDDFINKLLKLFPHARVNGSLEDRLPSNINISFKDVDTELLVLRLDNLGFAVSTKSSCLSGEEDSYVVLALNSDHARARSTLRITLGKTTKSTDLTKFLKVLPKALASCKIFE